MFSLDREPERSALARRFAGRLFQDSLFDRMFEDLLARWPGTREGQRPIEVQETDEGWTVTCELPGYDPGDVDVELSGDALTIRAEVDESGEGTRRYASFSQQVPLAGPVDADGVRAEHRHGVLTVTLPRSEASKPKKIAIEGRPERAAPEAEPSKAGPAGGQARGRGPAKANPSTAGPKVEEGQVAVPEEWEPPQT